MCASDERSEISDVGVPQLVTTVFVYRHSDGARLCITVRSISVDIDAVL